MRSALITKHNTLKDVEDEINHLLEVQPDAQIVSVIPVTASIFGIKTTWYKLVTIRTFNGFND